MIAHQYRQRTLTRVAYLGLLCVVAWGFLADSMAAERGSDVLGKPSLDSVQGPSTTESAWGLLNDGNPVGARFGHPEPYTAVVTTPDGGIIYTARAENLGRFMGRLTSDATWELWTSTGWSSDSDAQPIAIEHPHNKWQRTRLYVHPTIPGGLLGFTNQKRRVSSTELDFHGMPAHFVFDPSAPDFHASLAFKTWNGATEYDEYLSEALFTSWGGTSWNGTQGDAGADFALDATHRQGIAVIPLTGNLWMNPWTKLTAVRFDLDDPDRLFTHWQREEDPPGSGNWPAGTWSTEGQAPSPDSWILDNNAEPNEIRLLSPRIVHVPGTDDYLSVFTSLGTPEVKLGAIRYSASEGPEGEWLWWDGAAWQTAYDQPSPYLNDIGNLLPGNAGLNLGYVLQPLLSGKVVIIGNRYSSELYEVVYDPTATPSISAPTFLGYNENSSPGSMSRSERFATGVDALGTLSLFYVDERNDDDDAYRILLRERAPTGVWSPARLIWEETEEIWPEEVAFLDGREPVVFVNRRTETDSRLFAIGRNPLVYWPSESPLDLTPVPERLLLSPSSGLDFSKSVVNTNSVEPPSGTVSVGVAADEDGYVYTTTHVHSAVIVHAPNSTGPQDNERWGSAWEYFTLPGGIAVYDDPAATAPKVFAVRSLSGGTNQPSLLSFGRLRVWEMASDWLLPPPSEPRDHSYGYASPPPGFLREYDPQHLSETLAWSQGVAIDPTRGRLYATSAATNEIVVLDIENTQDIQPGDPDALFAYGQLLKRIAAGNEGVVDDIVYGAAGLTANGLLQDAGTGDLVWLSSSWPQVRDFVLNHSGYAALAGPSSDDTDFIRNLQRTYKDKRDRPRLVARIPLPKGDGRGEFAFPTGIAVDSEGFLYVVDNENNRVQKLEVNEAGTAVSPVLDLGSAGRGEGELLHPVGVTVTATGEVFVTDPENDRVVVFDTGGSFLYEFSRFETAPGVETAFETPLGVFGGREGYLYLSHDEEAPTYGVITTFVY